MAANKEKQNLRMRKVCERVANKISYKGLSDIEAKYVKTVREYEQVEKDLDNFYATCKRKLTGQVEWDVLGEKELDYFEYIYKRSESLLKKKSKLEEQIDGDRTMKSFLELNCRSVSF